MSPTQPCASWRLLSDLLTINASNRADALAVHEHSRSWTYAQLHRASLCWAQALQTAGVQPGDRVAVLMENGAAAVAAYFGILFCGAAAVPLHASSPVPLLSRQIADCDARALCTSQRQWHVIMQLEANNCLPPHLVGDALPLLTCRQVIAVSTGERTPLHTPGTTTDPMAPAVIYYTSGTSGTPRGVVLSHTALLENTKAIVASLSLTPQDCIMQVLPLSYCYGASLLHTHLMCGGSVVFENRVMYPAVVAAEMRRHGCTGFAGVAATFHSLATRARLAHLAVPTLRYMTHAGGHLAPSLVDAIRTAIAPAQFYIMYGQTEAGARLTILEPSQWMQRRGSVGRPIPGVHIQIVSSEGTVMPVGAIGEVHVSSPALMSGYFRQPVATATALAMGWLKTGDLGFLDAEGYLFLQGRITEFVKAAGHRVNPQSIDDALLAHPAVAEALTVGLLDAQGQEIIGTLVRLKPGSNPSISDLRGFLGKQLPSFMRPKVLKTVPAMPMLPNGKADVARARQWLTDIQDDAESAAR